MRIGAFIKQSFVDWEGKAVAVVFTKGCNFRCGFCHNSSLVLPELLNQTPDITEKEIFDYLLKRKNWIDGVVVTGGEPTIHNDLIMFIKSIKLLGYKIKLDTNGSNPEMLELLIRNKLIDFVAMDIKIVLEADKYSEITNCSHRDLINQIISSIKVLRNFGIEYQLRTTILPKFHSFDIINTMQQEFVSENYILQPFRQGETIDIF